MAEKQRDVVMTAAARGSGDYFSDFLTLFVATVLSLGFDTK
jgi:hypothetical protein